ncbi:TPA: HNH endonuclease [Pseudomonas aeruginosa]|uniref:HNH endonuclease n=2 Tax=Pseudomonas aeruginosa TaxID=287 RepID=UPI001573A6A7|nr:HNH endonuclease [Pseudomonas aeruginosa]MCC0231438.1 HNH endonuclease [Pseudomonas aeruginosa]NTT91179.1 HNH endonuclease [Pseudomonas aeruginosa]HCF3155263.1 HNH endonuclease [Pseudomonas aeruginosa]HCF7344903.1 HNH endonuclease [Pseudomonas aeruginosa]HDR2971087.1 HNH endonuclease [Pseudomonas aeruginosa]
MIPREAFSGISPAIESLEAARAALMQAVASQRSERWCLTLWGRFIRMRDGYRCVHCESRQKIQAHHIFRRTTFPDGKYELGNGITLCNECHRSLHAQFNGRSLKDEPLNARGGDDQDEMAYLYGRLEVDADDRGLDKEHFYFISDRMLEYFVEMQGYEPLLQDVQVGAISRIHFAHAIWWSMPERFYETVYGQILSAAFDTRQ